MRHALVLVVLISFGVIVAGCGREPVSSDRAAGETTGETTGSGSGSASPELRGVMDSYALAHEEIKDEGGEKEAGPYEVGYIVEAAEGWWQGDPQNLKWREPASNETNHIEILPFDKETGILVPQADIRLTVYDGNGDEVASNPLEFYYSKFYHYANNFSLPESGEYTLEAEISPPTFRRHGSEDGEGKVFPEPVTVKFENVEINTEE